MGWLLRWIWNELKKDWAWSDGICLSTRVCLQPTRRRYAIERSGNSVVVFTVSRSELSKQEIAALARGQWPCWDKIVKAVPEFLHSKPGFDACMSFKWSEHGIVE